MAINTTIKLERIHVYKYMHERLSVHTANMCTYVNNVHGCMTGSEHE